MFSHARCRKHDILLPMTQGEKSTCLKRAYGVLRGLVKSVVIGSDGGVILGPVSLDNFQTKWCDIDAVNWYSDACMLYSVLQVE